jgi:hypothetical protein
VAADASGSRPASVRACAATGAACRSSSHTVRDDINLAPDIAAGADRANAIAFDDGDRHRARCRKIS